MKNKYLMLLILIVVVVGTSWTTPDSRTFTKPEPPVVQQVRKQVAKHIIDANYLVRDNAPVQEVEVEVNDIEITLNEVVFDEENYQEDYFQESEVIENEITYTEPGLIYIGTYEITAYEWTGNPCANGNYPSEGYTVACNSLPLGTWVYLDGVGWRVVEDRGASWHGDNWMDLYLGDVGSCYAWGRQYVDVYVEG